MFNNFIEKIFTKNQAPEWFCHDVKHHVPEMVIKQKIRASILSDVEENNYDRFYWNDDYVNRLTSYYYKFFDQLYMQGA